MPILSWLVIALLLASAIIHAGWNAIVKGNADRLWSISVISLFGGLAALPFAFLFGFITTASLPFIAASSCLQVGYTLFLVRAYDHGDLAQVYPIARGTAPLLVTLGAAVFAEEFPEGFTLSGIAFVSIGILVLATGRGRANWNALISAFAAGCFIASYMLVDGFGVRVSQNALSYAAWQAVLAGILIPLTYVAIRRKFPLPPAGRAGAVIASAGMLSTLGYCIAIWAMSAAPMGGVSALRETSILFAALFSTIVLRERLTVQKATGAFLVTAGVVSFSMV